MLLYKASSILNIEEAMSNFDDDLMKGFTQYDSHFQKWCEKASPILGKVTQCGIFENDITGHGFLATNRPDF